MECITDYEDDAELKTSFCVQYSKIAAENASRKSTALFFAICL